MRMLMGKGPLHRSVSFSPLDLSPKIWLDPSDLDTVFQSNAGSTAVTNANPCGYMADKSGASFDLSSVADDGTRPTWFESSGKRGLSFDGSDDVLRRLAGLGLYGGGTSWTFIAIRCDGTQAENMRVFGEASTSSNNPVYYPMVSSANINGKDDLTSWIRSDSNATLFSPTTSVVATSALSTNNYNVAGIIDSGTTVGGYVNGVGETPLAYDASRSGQTLTTNVTSLGALVRATTSLWAKFEFYGLVAGTGTLSSGDISALTTWLAGKMA